MGNVRKFSPLIYIFFTVVTFLFLQIHCYSQIIVEYNKLELSYEEIDDIIIKFSLMSFDTTSENFKIQSLSDIQLRRFADEIIKESVTLYHIINSSNQIFLLQHTNVEIIQLICVCDSTFYLINMRHPLQKILDSLSEIQLIPQRFLYSIISAATQIHKINWYRNHFWGSRVVPFVWDEITGLYIEKIPEYNPEEW